MRRYDREKNGTTGERGFRIIEAGGRYLEPLTPPPPPRAPEPYKVASTSTSLGRAHRRSSFVIIAETRPATPRSRSSSPSLLPAGRVSPFRGRGFKGPLPHAQSRPGSPEAHEKRARRYGLYDRKASVSQQNSPKRSLIPQPTRRRSISLTKNNVNKASPKFGRRAPITRKNDNITRPLKQAGNLSRRNSLKAPDLSPIQGTPTKPSETRYTRVKAENSSIAKVSTLKARNTERVPINSGNTRRRTVEQDKSLSKESTRRFVNEKKKNAENESTTKIPMRRGSIVNKNGSGQSSTRFVAKSVKTAEKPVQAKNETNKQETKSSGNVNKDDDAKSENLPETRFIDVNSPSETKKRENDLGLIDLLRQSSGATGTSSVVNTTTTTAVQPLQIDSATNTLDKDNTKLRETLNDKNSIASPSPASLEVSPNSTSQSPAVTSDSSSLMKTPKTTNGNSTMGNDKKIYNQDKDVVMSTTTITPSKNNTSQKNFAKEKVDESMANSTKKESNGTNNGQGSREKTIVGVTGSSKKNLLMRNAVHESSRGEMRIPSANPSSRVNNSNNTTNNNNNNSKNEENGSGITETKIPGETVGGSGKPSTGSVLEGVTNSGHLKSDSRGSAKNPIDTSHDELLDGKRTLARNVGNGNDKNDETTSRNNTKVRKTVNGDDDTKFRAKNGSENSLKSSNGLSAVSAESIRSTDTGVSVNTVRGVSSAREKKGMHMMKRSEEIETLSGNVMHLERNGEPAVLDIAEGDEGTQDRTRLGRLKKSLAGFRERLPSMRWIGCRRNQKDHRAWIGENRSQPQAIQPERNVDDSGNLSNSRCNQMWTRLKNSCRCTRLRECKCCRRAARVAPVESTSCCPPERRCGAICGRIFSRCKCNRSEAQHTRSIRAKHSLTSVAPPPLSEEQRAKIPEVLVEHNSVMRGAIPCLPVPIAWFCLVWNVLIPGSGTVWSGLFNLCVGQPRFSISAGPRARFGALVVNLLVGVGQFFTVLFCLVGWGWSIWWGVTMIRLARKYKRFRASEAASSDLEARAGEPTGLPPGVPSQALRGMERAR